MPCFLLKVGSLDLQKLLTAKGKALKACKYFVSAISEPKIEIPMTSFYYVVSFDEKKSEHEESKTPPQRRMSLMHTGQKRFIKSHLKNHNPNYSFMYILHLLCYKTVSCG